MSNSSDNLSIQRAIAWCLAWGEDKTPQYPIEQIEGWRSAIAKGETPADPEGQKILETAQALTQVSSETAHLPLADISKIIEEHPALWESKIGLVYGGVTKVKQYVFESADLQEIRGASALLDRINLVDLPALFHDDKEGMDFYAERVREEAFGAIEQPDALIRQALIPELIIYSTGGNILAFCPIAFISQLCNAIEKRYTTQTLTAHSCAVSAAFRLLEIRCGLLKDPLETTLWHDSIVQTHKDNPAIQAYFGFTNSSTPEEIKDAFKQRKNFGELVGKLTAQFMQRRSGYDQPLRNGMPSTRPARQFPPMFETHPYLLRDDSDVRPALANVAATQLPDEPKLSDPTARKRRVGQMVKRESSSSQQWYRELGFEARWNPQPTKETTFQSWVQKFEDFLEEEAKEPSGEETLLEKYDRNRLVLGEKKDQREARSPHKIGESSREARSLHEIGESSNGYVGYIYADGNSMGDYIRSQIKTPTDYQAFSQDIFEATEKSVYEAIAHHIRPYRYTPNAKSSRQPDKAEKVPVWIHPFEIITIGGDDVLLIVPANKALEVAQTIGEKFEERLLAHGDKYTLKAEIDTSQQDKAHRYSPKPDPRTCCLSTSSGVLITAANTPIYYADKLVSQLLKSAKRHLKDLKKNAHYYGGTVDFLVLKAVMMISSNIAEFRRSGLTRIPQNKHTLKLYAAPYTLHDLKGLIRTVRAVKKSDFPKSQMYQIRSLLEKGKRTAILNYRYFRVRLTKDKQAFLERDFEQAWCDASTNGGNLAPWLTAKRTEDDSTESVSKKTVYETIWRELVDLEPFIMTESDVSQTSDESGSTESVSGRRG